jgi:hypothetical protein
VLADTWTQGLTVAAFGAVFVAVTAAIVRAVLQTYSRSRHRVQDAESLSEFFFDQPRNDSSGVPAKKGWTTKVDEQLETLANGQAKQAALIESVGADVKRVLKNGGSS